MRRSDCMAESDEFFKAAVVAGRTVQRLLRDGLSRVEARRLVKAAIDAEEKEVLQGHPFDAVRFISYLNHLPDKP